MIRRPPRSPLFPYPPLSRSARWRHLAFLRPPLPLPRQHRDGPPVALLRRGHGRDVEEPQAGHLCVAAGEGEGDEEKQGDASEQIGRAAGRGRGEISVGAVSLKKKKKKISEV